jgi:hypothetical protein
MGVFVLNTDGNHRDPAAQRESDLLICPVALSEVFGEQGNQHIRALKPIEVLAKPQRMALS